MSDKKYGSWGGAAQGGPVPNENPVEESIPVEESPVVEVPGPEIETPVEEVSTPVEVPVPVPVPEKPKSTAKVSISETGVEVRTSLNLNDEVSVAELGSKLRAANSETQAVARRLGQIAGVRYVGAQTATFDPAAGDVVFRYNAVLETGQVESLQNAVDKALEG